MRTDRAPRLLASLACVLVAVTGAGCGPVRDVPAAASRSSGSAFFPLVEGAGWAYRLTGLGPLPIEVRVRARGYRRVAGLEREIFILDEQTDGAAVGFADVAPVGYLEDGGYLARYLGLDYAGVELRALGGEDPVRFLPLELSEGLRSGEEQSWEEKSEMFQVAEQLGGVRRWRHRATLGPPVTVPAGTFEDVLHIESEYYEDESSAEPLLRFEDFYARDVGLVRSLTRDERAGGKVTVEQILMSYGIPAHPDATAP